MASPKVRIYGCNLPSGRHRLSAWQTGGVHVCRGILTSSTSTRIDFAKKVNDMTGGDLKIEVLPSGAVVPAFGLLDAVYKGTLDGGHGVVAYHYGKKNALALWGSGPAFGMDANMVLAWHYYGGGKELLKKIYSSIGANVVSFLYGPMPTQPLGWFKKPVAKSGGHEGPEIPHGRPVGRYLHRARRGGEPAAGQRDRAGLDRGLIDAAEFNNMSSDRPRSASRTWPRTACCKASTRAPSSSRSCSTRPSTTRCRRNSRRSSTTPCRRPAQTCSWKAIDRNSKDYVEMQSKYKSSSTRRLTRSCSAARRLGPDRVQAQDNPLVESRLAEAYAERAVKWDLDTNVNGDGVQPLLRRRPRGRDEEGLTPRVALDHHPGVGWCVVFETRGPRRRAAAAAAVAEGRPMQRPLLFVDRVSTWMGKAFAWLIVGADAARVVGGVLALRARTYRGVGLRRQEHDVRHALHDGGAYTLAKNGHVRGDFLYGFFEPRTQAGLDLVLYMLFFMPGVFALT